MVFTLVLLVYLLPFLLLVWLIRLGTRKLEDKEKKSVRKITNYGFILVVLFILSGGNIFQSIEFTWRCNTQTGYQIYTFLEMNLSEFEGENGVTDWLKVSEFFSVERDAVYFERYGGRLSRTDIDFYSEGELIARNTRFNSGAGGIYSGLGAGSSCPQPISNLPMYEEIFQGEER